MATSNFPKYQLSYFHGQGKSLQSVFRTDDEAEYEKKLAELLKEQEIDQALKEATPTTQPAPIYASTGGKVCSVHGVPMASAVSKNTGKPYDFHDLPEGRCFGHGVAPKKTSGYKQY